MLVPRVRGDETKEDRSAMPRGIALSLHHSVFNDLFFQDAALFWEFTWNGSKLLIGCAFLITTEHYLFSGVVCSIASII